jgi:PEP-CTERM motif-containing protein
MRAVGVALAVCVAVMYPSTAKADPIKVQAGAVIAALDAKITANTNTSDPNSPVASAQHTEQASASGDATFLSRGGLEQSAYFANHGSTYLFADDRSSFHDAISAEGLGVNLDTHITIALRAGEEQVYLGGEVCVMKVPGSDPAPATGTTPEPTSLLLVATGVAGALLYRRQLFA